MGTENIQIFQKFKGRNRNSVEVYMPNYKNFNTNRQKLCYSENKIRINNYLYMLC